VTPPYRLVQSRAELERAVEGWLALPEVALDTEFVHETTFWPRPGLIQIAADGEVVLIDAVAVGELHALQPLVTAATTRKLVHAASGDAALLERAAGQRPRPLFDTQVAAAYCGLGTSISYAALVQQLTGTELAKSETRTDWTRRPLSDEQLTYAAEDVIHLQEVARQLRQRLDELGRSGWIEEESLAASNPDPAREDPELAWMRLRGIERMPAACRRIAVALSRWRELEARRLDLPRTFVLRDESLREIARRQIRDPKEMRKVAGFDPRRHRRFAEPVIEIVERALASGSPVPTAGRAVPKAVDRAVADAVAAIAEQLDLPSELLLSRRARSRLIAGLRPGEALSSRLEGWRRSVLGPALDALSISTPT